MRTALFVAWRGGDANHGTWGPVGRLEYDGGLYRFSYTQGARTLAGFQPFPQMDDLEAVYESEELFPLFANRLLSPRRPEYDAYLRWGGFEPGSQPDPIAILGVTEGKRETDSVEVFPCPTPDADGCYMNKFFLHGVRWMPPAALARIDRLQPGERLFATPEPTNAYDPNAVELQSEAEPMRIGYVPRYLAQDVKQLLSDCDPQLNHVFVDRVNRDAPMQHRVLCRIHACWPDDFRPCSSEAFRPIPASVAAEC